VQKQFPDSKVREQLHPWHLRPGQVCEPFSSPIAKHPLGLLTKHGIYFYTSINITAQGWRRAAKKMTSGFVTDKRIEGGLSVYTAPPGTARHIVPMSFGRASVRWVQVSALRSNPLVITLEQKVV
jgi:hypothetical protein